jgi:hypothetical protein
MKAHIIENGLVANTIEIDSLDSMPNLVEATEGEIGWSYADGVFTAPPDTRTDVEKALDVRAERDSRLVTTDWTATIDKPYAMYLLRRGSQTKSLGLLSQFKNYANCVG